MRGLRAATKIGCGAALLTALSLQGPVTGEAKSSGEGRPPEDSAGISVTGIGFAPARTDAVDRAVRDARQRATAIASALELELGGVEAVELPQLTQFGSPVACRGRAERAPGCRPPRQTAAAASLTFAIVGGASDEGSARTVSAYGIASAVVKPRNRSRSRSIKGAILAARREVTTEAAVSGRRSARVAAAAAGLRLGTIVSVAEAVPFYYGSSFYDEALGSFGPGQFCGIVRRPVVRRDPETGAARVVRRVPHRRCFAPSSYDLQLKVRYEAS
jgi:hypothetical protein